MAAATSPAPCAPADTIPLDRTTPALDLTLLFNGFKPLFEGLSPGDVNDLAGSLVQVLQGESGTVDSLLRHIGSLTRTVAAKDQVVGQVVTHLNTVLTTLNDREAAFGDLVVTLQKLVTGFNTDRKPLGEAVQAIGDLTTTTAGLFQEGRAPSRRTSANWAASRGPSATTPPPSRGSSRTPPPR